jgi:flagellar biosynthesis protein FlhG
MVHKDQVYPIRQISMNNVQSKSKLITILSGKGGVGKSNIALNLSIALAGNAKKVALVDTNLHVANIDILLGHAPPLRLLDLAKGESSIEDITVEIMHGVKVISAGKADSELLEMEDTVRESVFHTLFELSKKEDYIIIDTQTGVSSFMVDLAMRSDIVIIVTTPDSAAISDAYAVMKILNSYKPRFKCEVLINQAESKHDADEIFEKLELVVEHFLKRDAGYLGYIMKDNHVSKAIHDQKPFYDMYPHCQASQCVDKIAKRVIA